MVEFHGNCSLQLHTSLCVSIRPEGVTAFQEFDKNIVGAEIKRGDVFNDVGYDLFV